MRSAILPGRDLQKHSRQILRQALSPSTTDAAHVYNAAIVLRHGNLEPATAPTAAVDPPDIPKTAVAEQPLALTATDPSASIEIGANVDGDIGLCACPGRQGD